MSRDALKQEVKSFWEEQACGERHATGTTPKEQFEEQAKIRYELEPFIRTFAQFEQGRGKEILEIGVGMGADHLEWAKSSPARLVGIDLTERAVALTTERFAYYGLQANVRTADAEALPFRDNEFDIVYSWGVLHHSPDTSTAIQEVLRVLKPGGRAKIMVYHHPSLVGFMLWARYALLKGKPAMTSAQIYSQFLESPGTKAYSVKQAMELMCGFKPPRIHIELSVGDLLEGGAGARHQGTALKLARKIWPRWFIRRFMRGMGLFMMIEAEKPMQ